MRYGAAVGASHGEELPRNIAARDQRSIKNAMHDASKPQHTGLLRNCNWPVSVDILILR